MSHQVQCPPKLPSLIPSISIVKNRKSDIEFNSLNDDYLSNSKQKIIKRDNEQCQFCYFKTQPDRNESKNQFAANGYLDVHFLDDNPNNENPQNMITVCPFCHQVFHIDFAGQLGRFKVIYFPWFSQAQLNLLMHCTFAVLCRKKSEAPNFYTEAQNFYSYCKDTLHYKAVQELGDAVRDPKSLGSALYNLYQKDIKLYKKRKKALKNIRILPLYEKFEKACEFWAKKSWHPGQRWQDAFEEIYNKWKTSVKYDG